ncbi:DUF3267 domain-containing protein [Clostridium estertheticum]|uniref:DUF3267 domain-containing protein n=1 Tax=Clostridium estertheticum TaxID=238834 RepID=UPI001C0D76F1|nr:DUF3267 domain-containing protein [Clostridium estertheticum]MBU3173327.1 DUF3267 domain-containing protein [Clostridium estertheticum]
MDKENYETIDETFKVGIGSAIISIFLTLIAICSLLVVYFSIWWGNVNTPTHTDGYIFLAEMIFIPFLHEYIHSITYRKMAKLPSESVEKIYKFPIYFAVHYKEIVPVKVRRWASLMPTIILFTLLLIIGLCLNNVVQTIIAGFMLGGGSGDMWNFIKLRKYKSNCFVEDYRELCGCIVYKPK